MVGFLFPTTCTGELQVNGVNLNRKSITYGDGETGDTGDSIRGVHGPDRLRLHLQRQGKAEEKEKDDF